MKEYFQDYKSQLIEALNAIDTETVDEIYRLMDEAREKGRQVFVLGNGGSAAAASHWVCDFGKGINIEGSKRMRVYSLGDNLSIFTALGNDISYEETFVEQLKNYLNKGDLVISLSVSGNSPNLVQAHKYAKSKDAVTVAIIGDYNGKLKECSNVVLTIKSRNYGVVEDIHMTLDHSISQYMRLQNS